MQSPNVNRGVYSISLSQFGLSFCFTVVMSFMPFYIIRISPYPPNETTIWIGLIMSMNPFFAAAIAPLWGSLTATFRPKRLFQSSFLFNAIVFLLMGFTDNLPLLLVLRIIQGALGGASTIGIFMISRISPEHRLAGHLSLFQNAMTAGSLLGPPVGAYLAANLGYRSPFIVSFIMTCVFMLLCQIYVADVEKMEKEQDRKASFNRGVLWGWALSLIATIHLSFLPSVLPHVLGGFGLAGESALKAAGFIMMGYTATSIIGSYTISHLTPKARMTGVIAAACLIAAFFQAALSLAQGVLSFSAIRMLQTGIISAVIPLVMAHFGSELGGKGIGFLNSARFAGLGAGPLLATFVLAGSNLPTLYFLIAGLTTGAILVFWFTKEKGGA